MEQLNNKAAQPRRRKEQIALLLKLHESHTGTTKDFCKQHNISEGAFYAARKRHSIQSTRTQQQGSGFTALTQPAFKAAHAGLFASVGEIKIYQAVTPGYLKALLP
jgi:hypothetical protein